MDSLKGHPLEAFDRSIDVHISRIRAVIEDDPKTPRRVLTVRGAGYVFAQQAGRRRRGRMSVAVPRSLADAAADGHPSAGARPLCAGPDEEPLPAHLRDGGRGAAAVRAALSGWVFQRQIEQERGRTESMRHRAHGRLGRADPALAAGRRRPAGRAGGGAARVVAAPARAARARRRRSGERIAASDSFERRQADGARTLVRSARRRPHAVDHAPGAAPARAGRRAPGRAGGRDAGRPRPPPLPLLPPGGSAASAWSSCWWSCSSRSPPAPIRWCAG